MFNIMEKLTDWFLFPEKTHILKTRKGDVVNTIDAKLIRIAIDNPNMTRPERKFASVIMRPTSSLTLIAPDDSNYPVRVAGVKKRFNDKDFFNRVKNRILYFVGTFKEGNFKNFHFTDFFFKAYLMEGVRMTEADATKFVRFVRSINPIMTPLHQRLLFYKIVQLFNPKIMRMRKLLDKEVEKVLAKDGYDWPENSWLAESKKLYEDGKIDRENLLGEIRDISILSAAISASTCWGLYYLSQNKKWIDAIKNDSTKRWARLAAIETLRIAPPILGAGLEPKPGMDDKCPFRVFNYSIIGLHKKEEYYPNPEKWDPMRFKKGMSHYKDTWRTFGGGDRECTGKGFSVKLLTELLYEICNKYDINCITPPEAQFLVVLTPANLSLSLTKRNNI